GADRGLDRRRDGHSAACGSDRTRGARGRERLGTDASGGRVAAADGDHVLRDRAGVAVGTPYSTGDIAATTDGLLAVLRVQLSVRDAVPRYPRGGGRGERAAHARARGHGG